MAKPFFIIIILCFINIFITISYNINDRIINEIDDEQPEGILNQTIESTFSSTDIDNCIPVRATKELGCILRATNVLFKRLFRSVCEQHQLCYACGFAHSITSRQCNVLALMNMYELCSHNKTLSFSGCLKQRSVAITLLRQHVYRSATNSPGFFFECRQQCVFDYLHAK